MFETDKESLERLHHDLHAIVRPEGFAYKLPPNSFAELQGEFLSYVPRKELIVSFCIPGKFSNPQGSVQGGIIAACFDDVFGPLGVVCSKAPVMSIDMNIQYLRSVHLGETFFIRGTLISMGRTTLFIRADAYNVKGKLLAQASTNLQIIRTKVPV